MKELVIVGATGMVGGHALRDALEHPNVGRVMSIGRIAQEQQWVLSVATTLRRDRIR